MVGARSLNLSIEAIELTDSVILSKPALVSSRMSYEGNATRI